MSKVLLNQSLNIVGQDGFIATYAELGPVGSLNTLERLWAAYYLWMDNDILATGFLFFAIHEFMYFGRCLPWFIIDHVAYFRKFKIQANNVPSNKEQWECLKSVLISHLLVEAFPIWFFHPLCEKIGISFQAPFPSWTSIVGQNVLFFFLEDLWHYLFHRGLHYGNFYRYIHKQHHRYAAPFGLAAEYAHPIEVMLLGFGTVGIPIIWCYYTRNLHLFTISVWITLRLFQAVDAHSGYEFPLSLHHFLPIWAGADHHDEHHHHFIGNYASSFRIWDYVLDTEAGETARQSRQRRSKRRAEDKALSKN